MGKALEFFPDVNAFMADRRRRHTRPSASAAGAGAVIGPFRVHLMGRWWTMVHELPDVKTVLNARDSELSFLDGFRDLMAGMLPKAFTFIPRHHFFLPLLREANLRSFVTVMVQEARPVLASSMMAARASSSMVDLFDACRRAVMRMNLRVLFGPQVFEAGRADAYYAAFEAVDPEKSLVDLLGSLLRPSQKERAWATIRGITAEMLAYYESREGADGGNGDEGVECALQLLVRQAGAAGAGPLDVDTVTNDLVAFVFASFTNTFAVLAWCIWELAGDKALQGDSSPLSPSPPFERIASPSNFHSRTSLCTPVSSMERTQSASSPRPGRFSPRRPITTWTPCSTGSCAWEKASSRR